MRDPLIKKQNKQGMEENLCARLFNMNMVHKQHGNGQLVVTFEKSSLYLEIKFTPGQHLMDRNMMKKSLSNICLK